MIPDLTSRTSHNVFTLNYDAPSARSSLILIEQDGTVKAFNFPVVGSTSGSQSISATNAITSGVWHDITVVFDVTGANNFSLYVDNVFYQGDGTGGSVGNSAAYDLGIGTRWSTKTSDMEGYLNNLRIWDRALTPAERAENYNGSATEYVCYDKLVSDGSSLVSGLVFDSSLEDATLTENTVNSTLTASGTPTYTDQGMTKLCGGTPT